MKIEVTRYRKPDGYATRFWSVTVNGELLAVTVYRKGAEAVALAIANPIPHDHVTSLEDSPNHGTMPCNAANGMAAYRA